MLSDKELEIIRQKMAKLKIEPSATAWNNIKIEIKPRKRFREFWWLGTALLLLGFLIFLNFQKQQTPKVSSSPVNISEQKSLVIPKPKATSLPPGEPRISAKNFKNRAVIPLAALTLKPKQKLLLILLPWSQQVPRGKPLIVWQ